MEKYQKIRDNVHKLFQTPEFHRDAFGRLPASFGIYDNNIIKSKFSCRYITSCQEKKSKGCYSGEGSQNKYRFRLPEETS